MCARALLCPRARGRGGTFPGPLLCWVLVQGWGKGWEPCCSTGCFIPQRELCSGHRRNGCGVLQPQGARTAGQVLPPGAGGTPALALWHW